MSRNRPEHYAGARWVRIDLHLHSPGSKSFTFPPGKSASQRDQVVAKYVEQLRSQGIEVCAITDYQQIHADWFTAIRERAREEGIYVYPGVELSFGGDKAGKYGLHVLAIFPCEADVASINQIIRNLDDRPGEPLIGRDLVPKDGIGEFLRRLRSETRCILVFPHPNDDKGLLKTYRLKEAAELLALVRPEAVEDFDGHRSRLLPTGKISGDVLARIATIHSSDNHRIEEIGTKALPDGTPRATYLKLSAPDQIQSLRLALRDSEILVRLGEEPEATHTRIETLEIDGNGFLGGIRLDLTPDLNVLIGGRGVGKSAVLEVIRYGLDLPVYGPKEYREGLVQYALGSGGKAILNLRQIVTPGVERIYRVERVWGEEPRVYELTAQGERLVELPPRDLFTEDDQPLFFGQREIYEITQSTRLRRELLDELIGRPARDKLREVEKIQQELRRNARTLLDYRRHEERLEEVEKRLREINHEIRLYESYGIAEKLKEETALTRDEERLKRLEETRKQYEQDWQDLRARWHEVWENTLADLERAESRQKDLLQQEGAEAVRELQRAFERMFDQGEASLLDFGKRLKSIRDRWREARRSLDEELRQIRRRLGDTALDPDRLPELTAEQERLKHERSLLRRKAQEAQKAREERKKLLQQLRDARREAFRLRQTRAEEIARHIKGRVGVEVVYRGQRKEYAERLKAFFSGSRIPGKDLENLAVNEKIPDGWGLAELASKGKEELAEKSGLSEARAQQLIEFLNQDERRWLELELLAPEDEVRVSLKVNGRWSVLDTLSAGQRATAMLLILLTQTPRPLLVDQPEDDLDNRFIFEAVVKLLRDQKGSRQLIMATHNANIPVLAHAELIVALEAGAEKARIAVQGGLDHPLVQDVVRRVMEGGDEAFRRRAEKYGLEV